MSAFRRCNLPRHQIECPIEHLRISASQSARKYRFLAKTEPHNRARYLRLSGYWETLLMAAQYRSWQLGQPVAVAPEVLATFSDEMERKVAQRMAAAAIPNVTPPLPPLPHEIAQRPKQLPTDEMQAWQQWCAA